jgi:hypothetical protein
MEGEKIPRPTLAVPSLEGILKFNLIVPSDEKGDFDYYTRFCQVVKGHHRTLPMGDNLETAVFDEYDRNKTENEWAIGYLYWYFELMDTDHPGWRTDGVKDALVAE